MSVAFLLQPDIDKMVDWRCPRCNTLLLRLCPGVGMHLEIQCRRCPARVVWTSTAPAELVTLLDRIDKALQHTG